MIIWFHEMGPLGWTIFWLILSLLGIGVLINLIIFIKDRKSRERTRKLVSKIYSIASTGENNNKK